MRDPYEVLGVSKGASEARDQERLPQARQETAPRRQQARPEGGLALCRAQRRLRDRRRRRQAQGLRPRRDRRRGQAALPGLRRLRRAARRRLPRRARAARISKASASAPTASSARAAPAAVSRRRLRGHPARHVRRRGARGARRAGFGAQFEPEDFGAPADRPGPARRAHHHAAGGGQGRQEARASAHRQGCRGQDSGRPRRADSRSG